MTTEHYPAATIVVRCRIDTYRCGDSVMADKGFVAELNGEGAFQGMKFTSSVTEDIEECVHEVFEALESGECSEIADSVNKQ